jgi:hypothetical protein
MLVVFDEVLKHIYEKNKFLGLLSSKYDRKTCCNTVATNDFHVLEVLDQSSIQCVALKPK